MRVRTIVIKQPARKTPTNAYDNARNGELPFVTTSSMTAHTKNGKKKSIHRLATSIRAEAAAPYLGNIL